jgi:23S rRNA pseudouridine2605 synthase
MNEPNGRKLSLKRGDTTTPEAPKLEERLHKVLAQAGLGSRRALEQRIADGLVKVNGEVAQTGMSIRGSDRVEIDGKVFVATALTDPARVLIYNKPEGEVTTREDPEGRPTIFEALPALKGARWIAIGRLDINTTGLLLLTTDGELANAMMHPSYEVEREYVCRVRAPEGEDTVSEKIVDRLRRGVALDDGPAKFDEIERIGGTDSNEWFRVLLKEGRNREVRRLWESQGCQISRLKRIRYGSVSLPQPLLRGQSQELSDEKVDALRRELKLEEGPPPALTLQPVIGQRKAAKSTVHVGDRPRSNGYVGGHSTADEGRELRRFDHVREDRGRGRFGNKKPHGGLTVSGEAAAKQSQKPFKQRKDKGARALPEGNPAAFRSWYVPEGVDTGPSGHRNPDGQAPRKPYGKKPGGGGPRPGGNRPLGDRGPGGGGGYGQGEARGPGGPRGPGARGPGGPKQGQRAPRPYGHPGNAPNFPSDHANPGQTNPYDRPRGPRPGGNRPAGNRPAGNRPAGPRGPKPGGNRGPRGGGQHNGNR